MSQMISTIKRRTSSCVATRTPKLVMLPRLCQSSARPSGEDFEGAIKIWAACALRLKKVGSFELAKNAVMNKARSGQNYVMDQSRMQTVESWAIMSAQPDDSKSMFSLEDGVQQWMINAAIGFVVLVIVYLL